MKSIILLPYYFKKIAIVILVLTTLVYLALFFISFNLSNMQLKNIHQLLFSIAALALFFLNFYKRKDEDESDNMVLKRLHCLFFSFLIVINFYILNALLNVVIGNKFYEIGAEIIFFMLLFNWVQMLGFQAKRKKVDDEIEDKTFKDE